MRLERDPGCLHSWDNVLASSAVKGLISWRTSSGITQILLVFLQTFLQLAGTESTQGAGALVISQSCRNSLESRDCVQGRVQGGEPGAARNRSASHSIGRLQNWRRVKVQSRVKIQKRDIFPNALLKEEQQGRLSAEFSDDSGLLAGCVIIVFASDLK